MSEPPELERTPSNFEPQDLWNLVSDERAAVTLAKWVMEQGLPFGKAADLALSLMRLCEFAAKPADEERDFEAKAAEMKGLAAGLRIADMKQQVDKLRRDTPAEKQRQSKRAKRRKRGS